MLKRDKEKRNSLSYKIKMFFYRLTFQDVKNSVHSILKIIFEIITTILGFLALFFIPAFFH